MSGLGRIAVHQLIVHKLDHRQENPKPELAGWLTPKTEGAVEFIAKHIGDHCEHRRARTARFLPQGTNALAVTADAIFADVSDDDRFIARSQDIANLLFAEMMKNKKISPGDLAVCLYSDGTPGTDRTLALLKLEARNGFRGVSRQVDGKTEIRLEEVPDVHAANELQKCAFIVPPSRRPDTGYDLIVLDQQTGRFNTTRQVATFFRKDFLQCEVDLNPFDLTQRFFLMSHDWADLLSAWDSDKKWRFKERIAQAIANDLVDVVDIAEELIADDSEREAYLDHLRASGMKEFTFPPDPEVREKMAAFTVFEGDDGLRLRVLPESYAPGGLVTISKPDPNGPTTITIVTNQWDIVQPGRR
jgi:hypothetical protein